MKRSTVFAIWLLSSLACEHTTQPSSDSGPLIAFVTDRNNPSPHEGPTGMLDIYTMRSDGSHQLNLTSSDANDADPCFSSDGSRIVFRSDRSGNSSIYVMNVDGSNLRRLTADTGVIDTKPRFSPDDSRIAFVRISGVSEIVLVNAEGVPYQTSLVSGQSFDGPLFSPDGSQLAYAAFVDDNYEIFVIETQGGPPKRLTNNASFDALGEFSPDGSKICFFSDRDGQSQIYIMDADGGNQKNLSNSFTTDLGPCFSPDGTQILFDRDLDHRDIYVMDLDGGNQVNLTNGNSSNAGARFSPDGRKIVFGTNRDGNYEVYLMNRDGSNQRNLTNSPGVDGGALFQPTS